MQILGTRAVGEALADELRTLCRQSKPHQAILPERKLAQQFGISHSTVRRVLDELQEQGLIYKVQGKGCFVADPSRQQATQCRTVIYADTWGNLSHPHYAHRLEGMMMEAEVRQLRLEVLHCGPNLERRERVISEIQRPEVVGLIAPWISGWLHARVLAVRPHLRMVTTASPTPALGVNSVGIDTAGIGVGLATYLVGRQARRLRFVVTHAATELGLANALHESGCQWRVHRVGTHDHDAHRALAQELAASDIDGLGFDDEVVAGAMLAGWSGAAMPMVSQASVASRFLPAQVARLEVDGRALGRLVIQVVCGAVSGVADQVVLQLRPTLIHPSQET